MLDDKSYEPKLHEMDMSANNNLHELDNMKKPLENLDVGLNSHVKANRELTNQLQESIDFADRIAKMKK